MAVAISMAVAYALYAGPGERNLGLGVLIAVAEYAFASFVAAKMTLSELRQELIDGSKSLDQINLTGPAVNLAIGGYGLFIMVCVVGGAVIVTLGFVAILFGWR